jgi:hypothetical protein
VADVAVPGRMIVAHGASMVIVLLQRNSVRVSLLSYPAYQSLIGLAAEAAQ